MINIGGGLTELGMYTVPKIKYKLKSLCHIFYKTRPDKSWFKFSKYCKCFKHHLNSVSKLNLKAIFVKILISHHPSPTFVTVHYKN